MNKQIKNLALVASLAFLPACANVNQNREFFPSESQDKLYHWEVPRTISMQRESPNEISPSQKYIQDFKAQFEHPYLEKEMDRNNDRKITLREQEKYLNK